MTTVQIALNQAGARFIEAWEGFRSAPYNDSDSPPNATIGVGHLLHYGPVTAGDREPDRTIIPGVVTGPGGAITLAEALLLEQHDVEVNAIQALHASLNVPLDAAQIAALCSLAFNCGPGSLAGGHTVMTAVNSKPRPGAETPVAMAEWHARAAAAFLQWAHPTVLTRRRLSEAHLFATSQYTVAQGNHYANA